jgi:metal-responsive CopG/Arc/MetJ family transcriptional regulator
MTGLSRETRLQIMLDEAELAAIDNYRFEHRMPSRAAAVRQLLRLGLEALGGEAHGNRRSSDYGVLPNSDADDGPAGV